MKRAYDFRMTARDSLRGPLGTSDRSFISGIFSRG